MTKFVLQLIPYSKSLKRNLISVKYPCKRFSSIPKQGLTNEIAIEGVRFHGNESRVKCSGILSYKLDRSYPHSSIHTSSTKMAKEEEEDDLHSSSDITPIFPQPLMEEEYSEQFRNTLFSNTKDPIILQLKFANSYDQVLRILSENREYLTFDQYCQSLLVLWDVLYSNSPHSAVETKNESPLHLWSRKNVNKTELKSLLHSVLSGLKLPPPSETTSESLVCCFLYSNRFGLSYHNSFIQELLTRIDSMLDDCDDPTFPITAISRLTIALNEIDELWAKLMMVKTLPFIHKYFDKCDNCEGFRALTISMISTAPFLREELLLEYEGLAEEFIRGGKLTANDTSTLIKSIFLLTIIYHKPSARNMVYKLVQLVNVNKVLMFLPHLHFLHKIAKHNLEPVQLLTALADIKENNPKLFTVTKEVMPPFLHMFTVPHNPEGTTILKEVINRCMDLESLMCIQLTTAYPEACHAFWHKVAQLLHSAHSNSLVNVCVRYLHFTARMGSYRNRQFESKVLSRVATELVEGSMVHQPYKLCQLAGFVLAFDNRQLTADITALLLPLVPQLNNFCCLLLSAGLRQSFQYQSRKHLHIYLQLDSALNERTKQLLKEKKETSLIRFNILLRSIINRNRVIENDVLWDVLKLLNHMDWSELTSRSLRNLVYNLQMISLLVPSAVDQMVDYCLQNRQQVTGDTVAKLLHLCFCLNYFPTQADAFFHLTAELVNRDRNMMKGLGLLQAALSLSYFYHLPPVLNDYIFTVSFLEKLDNEIKNCFAKDKYPTRVRQTLMQLNRSVCLDQPEADVPWFHSKFCEEQQALGIAESLSKTLLFTDVRGTLASIVGTPAYLQTGSYTPYGYSIDILLNLDSANNPVMPHEAQKAVRKVAVALHYDMCYTVHERRLKGFHQLKKRHLEILGYQVISITDSVWNAMFMTEPRAKQDYLKSLIWPTATEQEVNDENSIKS